ncbi:MAG: hypothetical protein H6694_05720 [Candidatus Latescibacteria bacterium]|nr:hypothetical protein [Candidatus Latescibacterota bacterium]
MGEGGEQRGQRGRPCAAAARIRLRQQGDQHQQHGEQTAAGAGPGHLFVQVRDAHEEQAGGEQCGGRLDPQAAQQPKARERDRAVKERVEEQVESGAQPEERVFAGEEEQGDGTVEGHVVLNAEQRPGIRGAANGGQELVVIGAEAVVQSGSQRHAGQGREQQQDTAQAAGLSATA